MRLSDSSIRLLLLPLVFIAGATMAARRLWLCIAPRRRQAATLRRIVTAHADSDYGRAHGFASIGSEESLRRRVPLNDYESLRPWIDRSIADGRHRLAVTDIFRVATTSGTTGQPKRILQSRSLFHREYLEYTLAVLWRVMLADPRALLRPLGIVAAASEAGRIGKLRGGNSANVLYRTSPLRRLAALPSAVFDVPSGAARYYYLVLFLSAAGCRCIVTPNPTTILELLEVAERHAPLLVEDLAAPTLQNRFDLPADVWASIAATWKPTALGASPLSDVRTVVTWTGGSCGFFARRLAERLPGVKVLELGLLATDSPICVPMGRGALQVLASDTVFAEFIPVDGDDRTPHLYHELSTGRQYELVLTNRYGLYRYQLRDVVEAGPRVLGSPTLRFVRKSSGFSNITGEKLSEDQLCEAIDIVEQRLALGFSFFVAVPALERRAYRLFCEYQSASGAEREDGDAVTEMAVAARIDDALCRTNVEYRSKRADGRLVALSLTRLPAGAGLRYKHAMLARGARDVQFKVRHLQSDTSGLPLLEELAGQSVGSSAPAREAA